GTVVQGPRAPVADLSAVWAVAVAGAARPLCLGAVFRQWCRWEPERQHGKSQSNSRCRALTLRLANPRKLLQGAPMRCPEKAGQTGEERHSREHGADEPAGELTHGSLQRDRGEPVYNEPMTVRGVDRIQRLDDRGNGEAGCGRDEHPACDDPRARGHAYRTQAGTIRCRRNYAVNRGVSG